MFTPMNTTSALTQIRTFFKRQRRLPTYQELADLMGFASKNAAYKLAEKLIEMGYLAKDTSGKLIPLRLFSPMPQTGVIKAGFPTVADEEISDLVSFDEYLIHRPEATFILTVSGDSMIDAGIHDGDIVLIDRMQPIKLGDIVAANVDGEWTLKYYHKQQGMVVLMPANKNYPPIRPEQSLEIAGVVISVIRKYH